MDMALRTATHPHDFKLLVASDGRRGTSMDDLQDANERAEAVNGNGSAVPAV